MPFEAFDEHCDVYDGWFLKNRNVLESELLLLAEALGPEPGRVLSVGCGSGLFESLLREHHGIDVRDGIEPAAGMAAIARKRGMTVADARAEELPFDDASFDTALFNGTPSYIDELEGAVAEARRVLRPDGRVVMLDVPRESAYALLYNLAAALGSWDEPIFAGVAPKTPYPIELARAARWRTTAEKVSVLETAGFEASRFCQTLCRHPVLTNDRVEQVVEGSDRGGYVAIIATRSQP